MRRRGPAALALAALAAPGATRAAAGDMTSIPAGLYTPFQRERATGGEPARSSPKAVAAFTLGTEPVTNAEFLAFVDAHPQWRKSRVRSLFADGRYLRRWPSDLALPDAAARDEPVTNVSWFAAEAYCKARASRLPTTEQWEYALADSGRDQDGVRARSIEWFGRPNGVRPPAVGSPANGFGVRDMVGLVWEWTLDFNAYATTAESRDPNGKESGAFCGGAAAGVADATDYPAFMRYALRASLKGDYTADNLGFRCAGAAP
jgi:formylglycine-generating enzyme